VKARRWDEGAEARDEVHGAEEHGLGTVTPGSFELNAHAAVVMEADALLAERWAAEVAADFFERIAIVAIDALGGVDVEAANAGATRRMLGRRRERDGARELCRGLARSIAEELEVLRRRGERARESGLLEFEVSELHVLDAPFFGERLTPAREQDSDALEGPSGDVGEVFFARRAEWMKLDGAASVTDVDATQRERVEVHVDAQRAIGALDDGDGARERVLNAAQVEFPLGSSPQRASERAHPRPEHCSAELAIEGEPRAKRPAPRAPPRAPLGAACGGVVVVASERLWRTRTPTLRPPESPQMGTAESQRPKSGGLSSALSSRQHLAFRRSLISSDSVAIPSKWLLPYIVSFEPSALRGPAGETLLKMRSDLPTVDPDVKLQVNTPTLVSAVAASIAADSGLTMRRYRPLLSRMFGNSAMWTLDSTAHAGALITCVPHGSEFLLMVDDTSPAHRTLLRLVSAAGTTVSMGALVGLGLVGLTHPGWALSAVLIALVATVSGVVMVARRRLRIDREETLGVRRRVVAAFENVLGRPPSTTIPGLVTIA